ncbi:MAG: hypothetical protein R2867_01950 [Caldilineaceae bacterium]
MTRRSLYNSRALCALLTVTALLVGIGLLCVNTIRPAMADSEALGSISGMVRDQAGTPLDAIELRIFGDTVVGLYEQRLDG